MNNQSIQKIITANYLSCPEFTYENPVLDRNIAKALSKGFVRILNLTRNSTVNNNLRQSILGNIRNLCHIEPVNHIKIDENITRHLLDIYEQVMLDIKITDSDSTDKTLDAFLIRHLIDMDIRSRYDSPLNPELIKALLNISQSGMYVIELDDLIHWDSTDRRYLQLINELWTDADFNEQFQSNEDLSIKLKAEIENILLNICYGILNDTDLNMEEYFASERCLKTLVKRSTDSANCFQISCSVLNYLFIMTNFDASIQSFIEAFVKVVRETCYSKPFNILYPTNVCHIVVLMETDIESLPSSLKTDYIESTKKYLSELRSKSENDFIMLLSHFPLWLDICFKQ